MVQILKKISDVTDKIAAWIMFTYVVGVTVLALVGVAFRAAGYSLSWNEELMRWLLIGIAYIGASVALKRKNHIGIEYFVLNMNKTFRYISVVVGYLAIIGFLVVVLYVSFKVSLQAQRQFGSILRIKMMYVKLNLPLGALFMLIHMTYFTVGMIATKGDGRDYLISNGHDF